MSSKAPIKPFLKWAGGKQALADFIIERFPRKNGVYYEPFVGGGSVFFSLQPNQAVISDHNRWLVDTYISIRDDWQGVLRILDTLANTKEDFLQIRGLNPRSIADPLRRAAHFIYLNKTCFRGLFRVNRAGQFNVPYGAYQRRYYDPENIRRISDSLQMVEIRQGDFEAGLEGVTSKDFVYFDPPYYKLGGYSDFNRYTEFQFREQDQIRLAAVCRELDAKGIQWALSNSDTAFIEHLYHGYRMVPINTRREINLNSMKRNVTELLIMNYDDTDVRQADTQSHFVWDRFL